VGDSRLEGDWSGTPSDGIGDTARDAVRRRDDAVRADPRQPEASQDGCPTARKGMLHPRPSASRLAGCQTRPVRPRPHL